MLWMLNAIQISTRTTETFIWTLQGSKNDCWRRKLISLMRRLWAYFIIFWRKYIRFLIQRTFISKFWYFVYQIHSISLKIRTILQTSLAFDFENFIFCHWIQILLRSFTQFFRIFLFSGQLLEWNSSLSTLLNNEKQLKLFCHTYNEFVMNVYSNWANWCFDIRKLYIDMVCQLCAFAHVSIIMKMKVSIENLNEQICSMQKIFILISQWDNHILLWDCWCVEICGHNICSYMKIYYCDISYEL